MTIYPGDLQCCAEPTILTTVLGSCVAVCLWDQRWRVGGMNHFVLAAGVADTNNGRYGGFAIDELIAGLIRLGCQVGDLQAKVFGGGAVLPFAGQAIGAGNIRFAVERLRRHAIPVIAQRTGGMFGRQIRFNTQTSEVAIRKIPIRRP